MFDDEIKIDVSYINWENRTGLFTVYAKAICYNCEKPYFTSSKEPSEWWSEWKKIPLALIEHSECPACKSKNIIAENIETIKTIEGIDISVAFRCKNCNGVKSQVARGLQNLWNKIESIKISPQNIEIIKK